MKQKQRLELTWLGKENRPKRDLLFGDPVQGSSERCESFTNKHLKPRSHPVKFDEQFLPKRD